MGHNAYRGKSCICMCPSITDSRSVANDSTSRCTPESIDMLVGEIVVKLSLGKAFHDIKIKWKSASVFFEAIEQDSTGRMGWTSIYFGSTH